MTVTLCVICFYNILACTAAHVHVMAMHKPETWPDFHISDSDWNKTDNGFDFKFGMTLKNINKMPFKLC